MAEWSKAADLRSVGQSPREFEPRFLHSNYFLLVLYLAATKWSPDLSPLLQEKKFYSTFFFFAENKGKKLL
jgi:hypothetical protein